MKNDETEREKTMKHDEKQRKTMKIYEKQRNNNEQ